MTYTELEAREKWCPFARAPIGGTSINRTVSGRPHDGTYCIGSACMAWRWGHIAKDPTHGYCGLAGGAR